MKLLEIIKRNIREYLIEGKDSIDLYEIARWGLEGEYEHSSCWDDTDEGVVYMIKGKTSKDNIDMKRTLWERDIQWLENEIVLVDDSDVEILSVKPLSKFD